MSLYLDLVSTRRVMAAKKDPASIVVAFFETASLETAATVLAICKGVVARRSPAKARPRKPVTERAVEQSIRRAE